MSEREAIHEIFDQIGSMSYDAARLGLLEEAVRLADNAALEEYSYVARMKAIGSAIFAGFPEKALVYFSWCVSKSEAEPERFPETASYIAEVPYWFTNLVWCHKWINQNARGFHQITREQLDANREKLSEALERNGYNLRPYWMEVARSAWALDGDVEAAKKAYRKFEILERDRYADCAACEQNFSVEIALWSGDLDEAIRRAEPLTDGTMSCAEVPHITYADLLLPTFFSGRADEARRFHQAGYPMVEDGRDFLIQIADHLEFVVRSRGPAAALDLFDRHIGHAVRTMQPIRRMDFWRASSVLFQRLANERDEISVRLPQGLEIEEESDRYSCSALAEYFRREAIQIARKFDARNGNEVVSGKLIADLDR